MIADKATKTHSDLNTFAIIVSILEGGHVYLNENYKVADKIIKLCKNQQRICLRIHDRESRKSKAQAPK